MDIFLRYQLLVKGILLFWLGDSLHGIQLVMKDDIQDSLEILVSEIVIGVQVLVVGMVGAR